MKLIGILIRFFGFFTAAAAGLLMLALALLSYGSTSGLGSWEKKTAVVVSSVVTKTNHVKGSSYCADIVVSYDYGGLHQSKLQIKDMPCSPIAVAPNRIIAGYPVGKTTEILVNPKNPFEAKANNYSRSPLFYMFLVLGLLLISLALYVLFFLPANKAVKRDAPQAARPLP